MMTIETNHSEPPAIDPWDPFAAVPSLQRWIWFVLAAGVCLLQGPEFVRSLRPTPPETVDFLQEWISAKNFTEGLPIYTSHAVTFPKYLDMPAVRVDDADADADIDSDAVLNIEYNAHPPTSVLLTLPFASLSYPNATLVWNLFSLAALGVSFWLLARELCLPVALWWFAPMVTVLFVANPFRQQMSQGQWNLILLLLLVGAWAAARKDKDVRAGMLLGLATTIKLTPGFMLVYFVVQRRWRVVISGGISIAAITMLTASVLGLETFATYITEVLPVVREFSTAWMNSSLIGMFQKLFDPAAAERRVEVLWASRSLAQFGGLAVCLAVVALWARAVYRAESQRQRDLAYGLSVTAMLLVSPITWDHYFLLLIIPLAILWVRLPAASWARGLFLLIIAVLCLPPVELWNATIPGGMQQGVAEPMHTLTVLAFGFYGLAGLFIYNFVVLKHAGEPSNGQS